MTEAMENVILFDSDIRERLLPLTFTRPICELRLGILTIREKWEKWLNAKASYITQDYLSEKYPINIAKDNYVINGSILPSAQLCRLIGELEHNEALLQDGELIAARLNEKQFDHLMREEDIEELEGFEVENTPFMRVSNLWDIFSLNAQAIEEDFKLLTNGRESQPIPESNFVIGAENIFLEKGAIVENASLNASNGPIYIGKKAEVMEGAFIRGPLAMCEHSIVKMGAKIYGATTLGPHSKAGGEVNNAVFNRLFQ